jgi:hypothetical protein
MLCQSNVVPFSPDLLGRAYVANIVWHTTLKMLLDLKLDDLGHPNLLGLWEQLYQQDRLYAARQVPVAERGLQCGGVCRDEGMIARRTRHATTPRSAMSTRPIKSALYEQQKPRAFRRRVKFEP